MGLRELSLSSTKYEFEYIKSLHHNREKQKKLQTQTDPDSLK